MPTHYLYELVLVAGLLTFILVAFSYLRTLKKESWIAPNSIYDIASRDLSMIGSYDDSLSVSIKYWVYSIIVAVWKVKPSVNLIDVLRKWNKDCNYDPDGVILFGIERANTMFLYELDRSREEKREPLFKVSDNYDYHKCTLNLTYNDYVDTDSLIERVDIIIGGDIGDSRR